MSDFPEPPVPANCELRDFPFTPIFRARLFGSGFHARATDAEWRAGLTLWLKSWDQCPSGSLPDDDIDLCRLAELGRDLKAWHEVRAGALRGWILCGDGRLYHPVVAEGVREAWARKQAQRDRTQKAREARLSQRQSHSREASVTDKISCVTDQNLSVAERNGSVTASATEPIASVADAVTDSVTVSVTGSKRQGQGQGQRREEILGLDPGADAPVSAQAPTYRRRAAGDLQPVHESGRAEADAMSSEPTAKSATVTVLSPKGGGGRRTRLPDGFDLDVGLRSYAGQKGLISREIEAEFEAFRNYHQGKGTVMADWRAAWRTWCMNAEKFRHKGTTGGDRTSFDQPRRNPAIAYLVSQIDPGEPS